MTDICKADEAWNDTSPLIAEQVKALYSAGSVLPTNVAVAAIASFMLWPLLPAWLVILWFALICIVVLVRMRLQQCYWRAADQAEAAPQWARRFLTGAIATGCLWGLCGLVILRGDTISDTFIIFTLGGTAAGSMVANASYLPAFFGFVLPAILPAMGMLIAGNDTDHFGLAAMLALFATVLAISGRNINRTIIANVRLRIDQGRLLDRVEKSEAAMAEAQAIAQVGNWECDVRTRAISWSEETFRIFGADPATLKLSWEYLIGRVHPEDRAAFEKDYVDALSGTGGLEFDHRIVMDDGTIKCVHERVRIVCDSKGQPLRSIGTVQDITARKRTDAAIAHTARHDVLTGLANRAVFVEAIQEAIDRARPDKKGFAVIYLDLDHFKDVNDTLGHPIGDELLRCVADRLRSGTRKTDTVARFGGDEFAVVAPDISEPTDAAALADELLNVISAPYTIQGNDIRVGASIGIDLYPSGASDAEALLSHADVALYRAKAEGRGVYRFFTDAMDAEVRTRVTLGVELREAIGSGQFFVMYQPQVAIDSGRIVGVEALLRWRHPSRGVLGPDLFVSIAENMGMAGLLGHWVLWEACRQAKSWLDDGIAPMRTAVNLSALQFKTPVVLESDVNAALAETGLPPQWLELEVTETALLDASRDHNNLLSRLRARGITIAIDDFGTGYSSLDYLRRFPVDRIKIAQNFVKNMETMPGNVAIVKATLGLARELNIEVIAEGVETQAAADLLQGWGCAEAQGYYFAKPLASADLTALLHAGRTFRPATVTVEPTPPANDAAVVRLAGREVRRHARKVRH